MSIMHLLIFQFIAYFLSSFVFVPKGMTINGYIVTGKFLKWHVLITLIISWLLSFQLSFIYSSLIIVIASWVINSVSALLFKRYKFSRYIFFISQLLQVFIIASVVLLYNKFCFSEPLFMMNINTKYLLLFAGLLACTKPTNIFIKEIFNVFNIAIAENNDLPNAGKLIGIIERFLVVTFIVLNQFEAVGFLIAAKSILRYKNDDTLKTEYVLIGTMLSFAVAIAVGITIRRFGVY